MIIPYVELKECLYEKIRPFSHEKDFYYVNAKYKLIFQPISNNASTSIRCIKEFDFNLGNIFCYTDKIESGKYQVFTILRNPLDRFISAYIEVCERAYGDYTKTLKKDFYWITPPQRFCGFLSEVEKSFFDIHIRPPSYLITDYQNKLFNLDSVIDFLDLEKDISLMLERYGLENVKLPKKNIRKENTGQLPMFKSLIKVTLKSSFLRLVNYRKGLYVFMDKAVRYMQRKSLPRKKDIFKMVYSDQYLMDSINNLYEDDWCLYNEFRNSGKSFGKNS